MDKYWMLAIIILAASVLLYVLLHALPGKSKKEEIWPRLIGWVFLSTLLLAGLYFVSPQQAEVVYYKFSLVICAAILGYWIDRSLFPYARPDSFLKNFWQDGTDEPINSADHEVVPEYNRVYAAAMIRRAIVVSCTMLAATMGL